MNNLQEFQHPADYDLEELPHAAERIAFIGRRALACGGPVLDMACGTGIVSLPLAALGLQVTGVDLAEPMIGHARHKAALLGVGATFVVGDMRTFQAAQAFRFIVLTGNAFQALLTRADQTQMLQVVAGHLAAGGEFLFETRNPAGTDLRDIPDEEPWFDYIDANGHRVAVSGTQANDAPRHVLTWTTWRRWVAEGRPCERRTQIECRFTAVDELDALLAAAGLRVKARFGGWGGQPFTARSELIVSVCEAAPRP